MRLHVLQSHRNSFAAALALTLFGYVLLQQLVTAAETPESVAADQVLNASSVNDFGGYRTEDHDSATVCNILKFGAVADNRTDNSEAFRRATSSRSGCREIVIPPGGPAFLTGPFNLSSHTILRVLPGARISGSRDPAVYPIVTQLPVDEAYRAPYMKNRQYQALVSGYNVKNVTVTGGGVIDGQGWDWWRNFTTNASNTFYHQRPKLVEFVDSESITLDNLTIMNSAFWTIHPIFCRGVVMKRLTVLAPRDHGNTDGIDPDSCDDVHVSDCVVDVGDDAVSVKSGRHWKSPHEKVPAQNHLFERVTILFRNFAFGSDVSGDVRNITFRDGTIGDDSGSSPWAIKLKTDSQEGGIVDGVLFSNIRIGNITYCGSSSYVFTPPHSPDDKCHPTERRATMINLGMGYRLPPTDPGVMRNVVIEDLYGIGPTGPLLSARGLNNPSQHIVNLTLRNISMKTSGGPWSCQYVDNIVKDNVHPWPQGSTC